MVSKEMYFYFMQLVPITYISHNRLSLHGLLSSPTESDINSDRVDRLYLSEA